MSLQRASRAMLLPVVLLNLSSCGEHVTQPVTNPSTDEVPFDLVIDVRNNLIRQYGGTARPVPRPEPAIRFDYRETSRLASEQGEAVIAGEFLFAIDDGPLHRGQISVFFATQSAHWNRTGAFRIDEQPVESHRLALQVHDSITDKPLAGVLVEARRVDDGVRSSRARLTDADGLAELEVLTGVFQIRAQRDRYRASVSDFIPVAARRDLLSTIRLTPDGTELIRH